MSETTILFLSQAIVLYVLLYVTHALRRRITIAPLYVLLGALTWIMWWVTDAGVRIELLGQFILVGSTLYFSAIIVTIFVIYLFDEPQTTRRSIAIVVGVSIVVPLTSIVIRLHSYLDPGSSLIHVPFPDIRINVASIIATVVDVVFLVVAWDFLAKKAQGLSLYLRSFITLLAVLWIDTICFGVGAFLGTDFLASHLTGNLILRFLTLLVLFPFLGLYIFLQKRRYHILDGDRTAKQVFSYISSIKTELNDTRETLEQQLQIKRQIKENEQLLQTMAANYPKSSIYVIKGDLTIAFASGQALINQEGDPKQFEGQTIHRVVGKEAKLIEDHFKKTFTGEAQEFELSINHEYHLYKTVPLPDDEGLISRILVVAEDISERKQVELALRDSESLKSAVLDNSPVGISVRSVSGTLLLANRAWQKIWNISDDDFVNRLNPREKFSFTKADNYLGDHHEAVRKVYETGGHYFVPEVQPLIPAEGKADWISQFFYAIHDEKGRVDKVVILTEDISERKKTEHELIGAKDLAEENETRFKALHNASFGGIAIHDKGVILECNQGLSDLTGYSVDDLLGMDGLLLIASSHREMVMSQIVAGYEKPYEARGVKKNGEEYPLRLEARGIPYKGKPVRVVEFRDISSEKLAEEALSNSHAKQKAMIENISDVISILDNKGIIRYVSPNVEKWSGWKPEDLIGQETWKHMHHEDIGKIERSFGRVTHDTDMIVTDFYRYQNKNGEYRWIETTVTNRFSDKNINGLLLSSHDITDRITAEEDRHSLEAQLRQSQKLETVGTMVGGVSHELNNVLQSLFLYGGLVQDELPDNPELKANFQHLLKDGERARDIVKQILTFSRKTRAEMKPRALHKLVVEALALQKTSFPHNIEIRQDIEVSRGMVLCDKTQIHQIVINLCNNALHAMESGGVLSISLKQIMTTLTKDEPDTRVLELKISDTGKGMSPQTMERIFDPFFTTKEIGQGTGLGLSVVHGIVEMMEGQIAVSSEPGEGTTFRILFPLVEAVEEGQQPDQEFPDAKLDNTILLVDDEASIRRATLTALTRKGFSVDVAEDGQQGLELFEQNPDRYDLIVTDLSMPVMSGTDLIIAIRKTGSSIPIILSTGELGIQDKEGLEDLCITGLIQKPWSVKQLMEKIQETLG